MNSVLRQSRRGGRPGTKASGKVRFRVEVGTADRRNRFRTLVEDINDFVAKKCDEVKDAWAAPGK